MASKSFAAEPVVDFKKNGTHVFLLLAGRFAWLESTGKLFIEGGNLEVLKLLQRGYANRVKMIYIDPPYSLIDFS